MNCCSSGTMTSTSITSLDCTRTSPSAIASNTGKTKFQNRTVGSRESSSKRTSNNVQKAVLLVPEASTGDRNEDIIERDFSRCQFEAASPPQPRSIHQGLYHQLRVV